MASIGELFAFLGSNQEFHLLCQDTTKSANQIMDEVFQNEELVSSLRKFVQDDTIIKTKMNVVIGQKRKSKGEASKVEASKDNIIEFIHKPLDVTNVIQLNDYSYMEKVGHQFRLVTTEYEMYY